jgi:hypothetical protein
VRGIPVLLADEDTAAVLAAWRFSDPATRERLIIFGSLGLVTLVLLIWAVFIRKKKKRRRKHHHSSHHSAIASPVSEAPVAADPEAATGKDRRSRRSRRRHRQRNPTLAETGGLPPIREQEPTEPSL